MSVSVDPHIGSELLGYRIEELVGRGGMGVVYRAYDLRLKRNVALKLVAPELSGDERFRERFLSEVEVAASLEHPNVVPIHDAGEVDDQLYLAMRYVEGSNLKKLLREQGKLEPAHALAICAQVADALDAAHERGLVHRDVKPSNVLLDTREHVYLADFGLAERLAGRESSAPLGLSLGTPAYAAPEQIHGAEVDARADIYSLGCLLYECLTGTRPFTRDSELAVLWAHLQEEPPSPPGYASAAPVFAKALAKQPGERYWTCAELVDAAREALGMRMPARPFWSRGAVVGAFGLTLIAAGLLAFFLRPEGGPSKPSTRPTITPKVDSVQRIDPNTNKLAATIGIGRFPSAVAVGAGHVWAGTMQDQNIVRIDPGTNQITGTVETGGTEALAIGYGSVWVSTALDSLAQIDPATLALRSEPNSGNRSVAAGEGAVWTVGRSGLVRFDQAGQIGPLMRLLPEVGNDPFVVVAGGGAVWVLDDVPGMVWRVDAASNRVVAQIRLGFDPGGIAFGHGRVWVTDNGGDAVAEIDPATNRIGRSIPVGDGPVGVAVGDGSVWVANYRDSTVSRVDPMRGSVAATISVGKYPTAVAAGAGGVWVTVRGG
jgi:YVTN family beta-propeller protein